MWLQQAKAAQQGVFTIDQSGWGFFPRHKLERVHVALRCIEILLCSFNRDRREGNILHDKTKSRHMGESPAMLPRAQTAYLEHQYAASNTTTIDSHKVRNVTCSRTSGTGLLKSSTKIGTAPASITI